MIRFTHYGGVTVTVGSSEFAQQVPQAQAVYEITERIPKGTVLFAVTGPKAPDRRNPDTWNPSRNWFQPDTPLPPVWDSRGNAWVRDLVAGLHGSAALQCWRCSVSTTLEPGDHLTMNFLGGQNGPRNEGPWYASFGLHSLTFSWEAGFELFGFSCLGSVPLLDFALTGYGFDGVLNTAWPGAHIDVTPPPHEDAVPYAPRLQLALYGTDTAAFSAPYIRHTTLLPTGTSTLPDVPFDIPDGWTLAAQVDTSYEEGHPFYPGELNTPEDVAHVYETTAGAVSMGQRRRWYYRVVPPGTLEDEIVLGPANYGGGQLYTSTLAVTFAVREIPCPSAGVDLLQLQTLMLLRSGASDGDVEVERSGDAGVTWPLAATVATDAGPSSTPTLTRNALDQVWCWYHNAAGNARGWLSKDLGVHWTAYATHSGLHFPRAVRQLHRMLLCAHDGTTLRIYRSDDEGLTLEEIDALALTCPEQLAAFAVDRRDGVHLVLATAAGALVHRALQGDDTWTAPTTLAASGTHPAYAPGLRHALLLYWDGGALHARVTDETYGAPGDAVTAPAGLEPGYLGLLRDQQETHWYVVGLDDSGARRVRYSGDEAVSWHAPF